VSRGVLLVTNERDIGADFVVDELDRRGVRVVRLNTERLPDCRCTVVPGREWRVETPTRRLRSSEACGVWWRRPERPAQPDDVTDAEWDAVVAQWRALCTALATVPGPVWVSPPHALARAEDKALQLVEAARVGLRVPSTIWTSDLSAARVFMREQGDAAFVKSVATAYWEERETSTFVFGRPLDTAALPEESALTGAPVALQQLVPEKVDVRVTVVGESVFAAECDAAPVGDWRLVADARWRDHNLPRDLGARALELTRTLGLRFAGLDLLRANTGDYYFIELNPNGEWGWLQQEVGLPLAHGLVEVLTG
jgi:glutathione synthase/RimK-type ligase-like ATP-grasp enzyme